MNISEIFHYDFFMKSFGVRLSGDGSYDQQNTPGME